jgi:hypothetical protein
MLFLQSAGGGQYLYSALPLGASSSRCVDIQQHEEDDHGARADDLKPALGRALLVHHNPSLKGKGQPLPELVWLPIWVLEDNP